MPEDAVVVAGRVGRPHGLDGSFHVESAVAALLSAGREVIVGGRRTAIERRAGTDERPLLRLAGWADRDAVGALRGTELLVPRAEAPPLAPDEFYAADLVGCRVTDGPAPVGEVSALVALPSCEALEVDRGPDAAALLVPLVRDAVRAVDVPGRRVDVDLAFLGEVPAG